MSTKVLVLGIAVLFGAAGAADAAQIAAGLPAGIMAQKIKTGTVLANANGFTLYTYDDDVGGKPSCYDFCARTWLPLLTSKDAMVPANWSLVPRTDGSTQMAYKGKPLYFFATENPGEMTGDGMGGVWHAAKP